MKDCDRPVELHYHVIVKAFGHPRKVRQSVGRTLAKILSLNFNEVEVRAGTPKGNKFTWDPSAHDFGLGEA